MLPLRTPAVTDKGQRLPLLNYGRRWSTVPKLPTLLPLHSPSHLPPWLLRGPATDSQVPFLPSPATLECRRRAVMASLTVSAHESPAALAGRGRNWELHTSANSFLAEERAMDFCTVDAWSAFYHTCKEKERIRIKLQHASLFCVY